MKTEHITIEDAEKMAQLTDYAWIAVEEPGSEINWADAGAFYLEGFNAGYEEGQSSPKIKQLEWKETNYYIEARTKIGKYLTMSSGTSINSELRVQMYFCGTGEIVFDGTLGEAKEAAQADFEKRVKECLITE